MYTDPDISPTQKQAALTAILQSNTFARSEQLRSFLRYVCEIEFAGRGDELSEYLIGVEALGRPADYSPGIDSAVRNRALTLRKKLVEYYEQEAPDAPVRIEFSKGSFCPNFINATKTAGPNNLPATDPQQAQPAHMPSAPAIPPPTLDESRSAPATITPFWQQMPKVAGLALMATLLIGNVIQFWQLRQTTTNQSLAHAVDPLLAEVWGPILTSKDEVIVRIASATQFSVHPDPEPVTLDPTSQIRKVPMPVDLLKTYREWFPNHTNPNIFLTVTSFAGYWGDVAGMMTALKMLNLAGVQVQALPEQKAELPMVRNRNLILFGTPEYSTLARHFLEKYPFTAISLHSIASRDSEGKLIFPYISRPIRGPVDSTKPTTGKVFGLVTVFPGESSNKAETTRVIIFSGTHSAGAQAAAEFFTSPKHLAQLKGAMQKTGLINFPPAYQVVINTTVDNHILVDFTLETFRVI